MTQPTEFKDERLDKTVKEPRIKIQSNPRWARVKFAGETIADSKQVLTLHEKGHLPVYYFPESDLNQELLIPSEHSTHCPLKGDASYWSIRVGERIAENAVWSYLDPIPESKEIQRHFAFYWNQVDQWFEEEEEIFVHPRDPFKRVDAISSSRHIRVELDGRTIAESRRPVVVFETGLPVRYYLPQEDVHSEYLKQSDKTTRCPYKGIASYHSVKIEGNVFEDLIWSYENPIPEIPKIAGLLSFYNERVNIYVDGELETVLKPKRSILDSFEGGIR